MRKSILIILSLLLTATWAMAERTGIHASDTRFTFVGRHSVDSSTVSMDYTGAYVRIHFYGTYLSVRLKDSGRNYYNLYLDRPFAEEPDKIITTEGDTTITLFSAKRPKEHTVMLYKRTEGEQGRTTFEEFFVDGELLQAEPLKKRQMEFIGDSYTCGYGTENSGPSDRFSPRTETSAKTYAAILARYFDADFTLVAHSGFGVARNYNSKYAGWYMPDRYCQTFDMDSTAATRWNASASAFHPQLTVILLGGNDFSVHKQPTYEAFQANYQRLLLQIKANYGSGHPILCCVMKDEEGLTEYVHKVLIECGLDNIYFCPFYTAVFGEGELFIGADKHPNYQAHRYASHVLVPYVSTITGWPLTDRPIY